MNQRNQQLDALLDELRRTKRVRRARGAGVITGGLVLALGVMLWPAGHGTTAPAPSPGAGPRIVHNDTPPEQPTAPVVARPALIAVSKAVTPSTIDRISDDTLLELLNTDGRRTGLIKRGDEVTLDAPWLSDAFDDVGEADT